ncbi:MAG: TIGR02646 family protein [Candidatus Parabeggiatoa sp. nov. 2]|nr:MAG: TIGR02646 family protein [Beggiatoa sp. 4572_84]RKZ58113.1 MAG: TIGR02646 family protein [Gammaproteobacteria bacterium]
MKYIKKSKEPASLRAFIEKEQRANIHPSYSNLDKPVIEYLNKALLKEQGYLCCYCMEEISLNSLRREHFLPQSRFKEEELNYSNLFAACNFSDGLPPEQQHCDIKKAHLLIPKYISDPKCSEYFRYNRSGEILPYGSLKRYKDYCDNYNKLNAEQKTILTTIEVLNLNAERLSRKRQDFIFALIQSINGLGKDQIEQKMEDYKTKDSHGKLKRFCGVAVYILEDYLKRKTG